MTEAKRRPETVVGRRLSTEESQEMNTDAALRASFYLRKTETLISILKSHGYPVKRDGSFHPGALDNYQGDLAKLEIYADAFRMVNGQDSSVSLLGGRLPVDLSKGIDLGFAIESEEVK